MGNFYRLGMEQPWPGGCPLVIYISTRVTGDRPIMEIGYKYIYQKVQRYISMDASGSTGTGVPYLSSYPDNCSNVSIRPIFRHRVITKCFSA